MLNKLEPTPQILKLLTFTAAVFMLLPLFSMQYVGEEGVMAIKSYEMFVRDDWMRPSVFGMIWPHSPLWHWPVIGISMIIGWEHVDASIRLVSVLSSWTTALCVGLMANWLYKRPTAGWLGALIYLSMGEIALWYGWLGYLDSTFGMFIFAAIATLWRTIEDEHIGWFICSLLLISLAFLTKNITAYGVFGFAGLALLWQLQRWYLLKHPLFLTTGLLALTVPWLWQSMVVLESSNTASTTASDVLRNFMGYGLLDYLGHWIAFPFIFAFRALPVSLFVIWLKLRHKHPFQIDKTLKTGLFVLLACFLPFWLSAGGTPRYLVPLYGIVALVLTGLTLQLNQLRLRQAVTLITIIILFKIPYSFVVLPYIKDWRPERDVKVVAEEVMRLTENTPLRTQNDVSTGLAIAAYIDVWRRERPPISWYRNNETGVYILAEVETPKFGRLIKTWRLRGDHVYLYRQADQ